MADGVFCTDALAGIVGQQLGEDVLEVLRAACREELVQPCALLGGEVDLHVRGLALEPVQQFLAGRAEDVVDAVDLVELVLAGEEGFLGDELEQHAAEAPDIHLLVIVAIGHEALRRPVPPGRDVVGIGRGRVLALAGAQIRQLDEVAPHKYVFGLDIAMEDALAMHELNGAEDLEHVKLDALEGEGRLLALEALVQVHIHKFED